ELHLRKVLRVVPYLRGRPHPDTVWKNGGAVHALFSSCVYHGDLYRCTRRERLNGRPTGEDARDAADRRTLHLDRVLRRPERGLFMEPPQQYTFDYQRDARIFRIAGYNCCDARRERQWHRWSG